MRPSQTKNSNRVVFVVWLTTALVIWVVVQFAVQPQEADPPGEEGPTQGERANLLPNMKRVARYSNQQLVQLPDSDLVKLNSEIEKIYPPNEVVEGLIFNDFEPYRVWELIDNRFVLVEGAPLMRIPGESKARVTVLDKNGVVLSKAKFPAGYRIHISDATLIENSDNSFLFAIESGPVINGQDVCRQIYALDGNDVVLVRLLDGQNEPVPNQFYPIGPEVPAGYLSKPLVILASGSREQILALLARLQANPNEYSDDKDLGHAIRQMVSMRDQWIADAAKLTLQQLNNRSCVQNKPGN